jgi:hypothetical protein
LKLKKNKEFETFSVEFKANTLEPTGGYVIVIAADEAQAKAYMTKYLENFNNLHDVEIVGVTDLANAEPPSEVTEVKQTLN